jgi:hypothetical protein
MIQPNTDILLSKYDRQINKTCIEKDLLFGSTDGGDGWTDGRTDGHLNIKKYNQSGFVFTVGRRVSCNTSGESKEDVHCLCFAIIMMCRASVRLQHVDQVLFVTTFNKLKKV